MFLNAHCALWCFWCFFFFFLFLHCNKHCQLIVSARSILPFFVRGLRAVSIMHVNRCQLAQLAALLQFISSSTNTDSSIPSLSLTSSLLISNIVNLTSKARTLHVSIERGTLPPEILRMFFGNPSERHVREIIRILRSETWRLASFLKLCLGIQCIFALALKGRGMVLFRSHMKSAQHQAEVFLLTEDRFYPTTQ